MGWNELEEFYVRQEDKRESVMQNNNTHIEEEENRLNEKIENEARQKSYYLSPVNTQELMETSFSSEDSDSESLPSSPSMMSMPVTPVWNRLFHPTIPRELLELAHRVLARD